MRVIAIVLVVLGHATRDINVPNLHMYGPTFTPYFEVALRKYIYSFHMPLFFWITGYVFFYSTFEHQNKINRIDELIKKAKRLLIPLYAASFLVYLPVILCFGHPNGSITYMHKCIYWVKIMIIYGI